MPPVLRIQSEPDPLAHKMPCFCCSLSSPALRRVSPPRAMCVPQHVKHHSLLPPRARRCQPRFRLPTHSKCWFHRSNRFSL